MTAVRLKMSLDMAGNEERFSRLHEIEEFCANTTSHGLGQVAAANSWPARAFWMLIFTCSFLLAAYHISLNIQYYLRHSTKTDIFFVTKERLQFPSVTVCNSNPLKLSKLINISLLQNKVSNLSLNYIS